MFKAKMLVKVLICVLLIKGSLSEVTPTEDDYLRSLSLLENDLYHLFWKYDDTSITFEVHAKTLGWVGFGLSPTGKMEGSDMIISWIKDGETFFTDRHAVGYSEPIVDPQQDWELLSVEESGEFTIIKMTRQLLTGDPNDLCITGGTSRLIYAFHEEDPASNATGTLQKHTMRTSRSVQLLGPATVGRSLPDEAVSVDFVMSNGMMFGDTTYWCEAKKLPEMFKDQKHHMIMYEPVLEQGHESFVHHILLYACHVPLSLTPDEAHGLDGHCYFNRTIRMFQACDAVLAGWAVGAGPVFYPENVGYPIGEDEFPNLFRLEVHYDNPDLIENIVDHSGMRLWFTPILRPIEAGVILAGMEVNPSQLIPSQSPAYVTQGICHGSCLREVFDTEGISEIKVFGTLLHSHIAGRAIRLRHFRDGVELPPIIVDNSYDFNFQENIVLEEEVTVKAGDHLMVQCAYNTEDRDTSTVGGLSTRDEMCLVFVAYYPRINLGDCQSAPTYTQLSRGYFGDDVDLECKIPSPNCLPEVTSEGVYKGKTLVDVLGTEGWNNVRRKSVQRTSTEGDIEVTCESRSGEDYAAGDQITNVPEILEPYDSSPNPFCIDGFKNLNFPLPSTVGSSSVIRSSVGLLIACVIFIIAHI